MSEFIKNYQLEVWNLFSPKIREDKEKASLYLAGKLSNEVAELWEVALRYREAYLKNPQEALQTAHTETLDESGDCGWYVYNLCTLYGVDVDSVTPAEGDSFELTLKMTVSSGKLLGLILKKQFHNKPVEDSQITDLIKEILSYFVGFVNQVDTGVGGLENVLDHNLAKLHKRHGTQYNPSFYTGTAS
jgi:hypothetical protein